MKLLIRSLLLLGFVFCFFSCEEEQPKVFKNNVDAKDIENYHIRFKNEEKYRIEKYIDRSGLKMQESGSGLYYKVYNSKPESEIIEENNKVTFNYVMYNLKGDTLYIDKTNTHSIITNGTDAESGIHEGLMKLREGESGLFIMTSQLGHGLMGDKKNIAPQTTLKVEVDVIKVEKPE